MREHETRDRYGPVGKDIQPRLTLHTCAASQMGVSHFSDGRTDGQTKPPKECNIRKFDSVHCNHNGVNVNRAHSNFSAREGENIKSIGNSE